MPGRCGARLLRVRAADTICSWKCFYNLRVTSQGIRASTLVRVKILSMVVIRWLCFVWIVWAFCWKP